MMFITTKGSESQDHDMFKTTKGSESQSYKHMLHRIRSFQTALWKECLNSDCYNNNSFNINISNNHLSLQLIEYKHNTMIYNHGNPGPGLEQAHKCGGVKPLMGSQPIPLDNCISNGNKCINNIFASTQKYHILSQPWIATQSQFFAEGMWILLSPSPIKLTITI